MRDRDDGTSDELARLIGAALAHALELIDDESLLPFVYAQGRVLELDPADWPELAADVIAGLPASERYWVLVAPELEPETGPGPCLHVRAGERDLPEAFMFEQHFRERGFIRSAALVGELVHIGGCENPMNF